jgi:hypothetical protein
MTPKRFDAASMMDQGRARTSPTVPELLGTESSSPPVPAPPAPRPAYERVTFYVRPAQRRWARTVARGLDEDGSISASDLARLGLDLAAELDPAELRSRIVAQAHRDDETGYARANRGLPSGDK